MQIALNVVIFFVGLVGAKEEDSKVRGARRAATFNFGSLLTPSPTTPGLNLASLGLSAGAASSEDDDSPQNLNSLFADIEEMKKKNSSSSGAASGCDCGKDRRNKPTSLKFQYNSNGQNSLYQDSSKATCRAGSYPSSTTISVNGQLFSVSDGTEFTVNNINGANTELNIGGQSCTIHSSCSVPIVDGDQIGPLIVIGANGQSQTGINYCCGTCCRGSCNVPVPSTPEPTPAPPPTAPPTPEPVCPKPFDETCPPRRPVEGMACKFFGNELIPNELYQKFILNRQFQTITEPRAQTLPPGGCRYRLDETDTTQIDSFCICALDNDMNPECGRTVCEFETIALPTPPPTPHPTEVDPVCDPTDVCPPEKPVLGSECDWADAGLCQYDQCDMPRADGSMPEAEYFCACVCDKPDTLCGDAVCELRLCAAPNEPWCPDGLTIYMEDFEDSPNTFDQWSNGRKTTIGDFSTFLGPYSDNQGRPCRRFNLQPYASAMVRFSFDLYEYLSLSAGDVVGVSVGDEYGNNEVELLVSLARPSGITHNGDLELSWEKYEDSKYKFNLDIRREFLYINNYDVEICFHWELVGDNDAIGFDNMEARACEDNCPPEPYCPFEKPKQNWPCELHSNVVCGYDECEGSPGTYESRCTCIEGRFQCEEFSTCPGNLIGEAFNFF